MTTDLDVKVAGAAPSGDFTITLEVVDIDDTTAVLATDSSSVDVQPAALAVLWGADLPVLGTQDAYFPLPVRVYSPVEQQGTLTFTLTGPEDDPNTQLLEELEAGEAKVFASDGLDMVPMNLSLSGQDELSGTWPASLNPGYTDLVWYLMVNEGAPVGQYGIDVGIQGGTDLAETAYVSFAAPAVHGQQPPDSGEDTTAPVVMITTDAITSDAASFSFVANEDGATLKTLLAVGGVKGEWEDAAVGTKTYTGLEPGDYVFYVKVTDLDGNAATYITKFTIPQPSPTIVDATLRGKDNGARADRLKVVAGTAQAAGATVNVFKIRRNGNRVLVETAILGANGKVSVVVPDKNGWRKTKYVAKLAETGKTTQDWTNRRRVR